MKVIHLIPADGLGGVEQAARSLRVNDKVKLLVAFLSGDSLIKKRNIKSISKNTSLNSPFTYIKGIHFLINQKPDLLVCSLWRSSLIGILYNFYRKKIKKDNFRFVLMIHASKYSHLFDNLITKLAIHTADEVWCDSVASKNATFKKTKHNHNHKVKVISFLVKVSNLHPSSKRNNDFIFWGRLAKVKRLDKGIKLFREINEILPESKFYIYGPDGGEQSNLKNLVRELNLTENVYFMGPKLPNDYPEEVRTSKFFINTSDQEGMAIAVTEAMQLGLVPIVTPAGEIANYCIHNTNSIYYDNLTIESILDTINNPEKYQKMQFNAIRYWATKLDYSDDFTKNCHRVLSKK